MTVVDPQKQAEIDQGMQAIIELIPRACRGIYLRSIEEGFDEVQAMTLCKACKAFIHALGPNYSR